MILDNTTFFKARVKMLNNKDAEKRKRTKDLQSNKLKKKNSANFCFYTQHTREIVRNITEFRNLVLNNCSTNNFRYQTYMSENDRKCFDINSEVANKQCLKLIRCLTTQISTDVNLRKEDELLHLKLIIELLANYCRNVYRMVLVTREVHKKKCDYLRRICRLANLVKMYESSIEQVKIDEESKIKKLERLQFNIDNPKNETEPTRIEHVINNKKTSNRQKKTVKKIEEFVESTPKEEFEELSNIEQDQLIEENKTLIKRFSTSDSEILHIETQMEKIQLLQNTFSEKIFDQEKGIDHIHSESIHTLENLEVANEYIREAIRNTATRRVIILFCLIVLTFTLLFLDWYNP